MYFSGSGLYVRKIVKSGGEFIMQARKIQLIECKGTSHEIGRQYGEAARDHVLQSMDFMFDSLQRGPFGIPPDKVLVVSGSYIANA